MTTHDIQKAGAISRQRLLLIAGFAFHVIAMVIAALLAAGHANAAEVRTIDKAIVLPLETLQGSPLDTREKGKVQVLNFWASWCSACSEEMPALEKFSESMRGKPVEVTLVNVGDSRRVIEKYMQKYPLSLPVVRDPDSRALSAEVLGLQHLPATLVIDRKGRARWMLVGKLDPSASALRARVSEALKDS
jgi:cytochrome c biogenesis protein CcmG/thiol:disulfide interchange protein DsbE